MKIWAHYAHCIVFRENNRLDIKIVAQPLGIALCRPALPTYFSHLIKFPHFHDDKSILYEIGANALYYRTCLENSVFHCTAIMTLELVLFAIIYLVPFSVGFKTKLFARSKISSKNVINTIETQSLIECGNVCAINDGCAGFKYESTTCSTLNALKIEDVPDLEDVYVDTSKLHMYNQH